MAIRTNNNPEMLIWAREEMRLDIEAAADLLGISQNSLTLAESGERALTLNQLRVAAKKYNCPLGYFYLSEPPYKSEHEPVPDYRVAPEYSGVADPRLNREINKARNNRNLYIEINNFLERQPKKFVVETETSLRSIGRRIRHRLNVDQEELESLDYDEAYKYWKSKIEGDGVLVYETQYIPKTTGVIGIALFYEHYPIILVGCGAFSNQRKLFTLLHEYAHLLFGVSALNDSLSMTSFDNTGNANAEIESRCNQIAAEILIPSDTIDADKYMGMPPVAQMQAMSRKYKVTYTTAAVCLRKHKLISQKQYETLVSKQQTAFAESQAEKRGKNKKGGSPREFIQRLDLGRPMFDAVLQAYSNEVLDVLDTAKILKLEVAKVDKLMAA